MLFFENKKHFEDCPNRLGNKALTVKVDVTPELDVKELEVNGNVSKPDKKLDIKEEMEAYVLATKSTHCGEASKFYHSKKIATKPHPTTQYGYETTCNSKYTDRAHKPLWGWWKNDILSPRNKEHANMAIVGEPRELRESIELSDANK